MNYAPDEEESRTDEMGDIQGVTPKYRGDVIITRNARSRGVIRPDYWDYAIDIPSRVRTGR